MSFGCLFNVIYLLSFLPVSICICFEYKHMSLFCLVCLVLPCLYLVMSPLLLVLPSCVAFMCRDKRHLQPWGTLRPYQREVVGTIGLLWPSQQGGRWSQLITKVQGQGQRQGEGQDIRVRVKVGVGQDSSTPQDCTRGSELFEK